MLRLTKKSERDLTKISYLAMATSAAESLLTSINDLLDLSKAESGALAVVVTSCDVLECVHRALATVAPRVYEKREIELLLCNPPGHLPQVMADDARLGQVIVNLVGNSAKFTERGSIVVSIEVDTKLTITVSDTGIGIPVNRVSQVFEPFVQVDSSATRSNQGTGLGLTITKQLVEAMGGEISLSSVEGAGTSVQIRLSLATTVADNDTSTHRKFDSDVFLVARHPDLLRVLGAGLKEHGCNVSSVSTLEEVPHGWRGVALVDGAGLGDSSELMKLKTFIEASSQQVYVLLSPLQLEVHQSLVAISNCRILLKPCSAWSILSFFGTTASDCPRDQTQDAPAGPSLRVAIADDLPTSQIILAELLREGGHHVEVASNGVELLRILMAAEASGKPFDIVFSDVEMPQMDGVTVLKQVRERDLSRSTHLPFVLLTAHAFAEDKERFIALGADLVITKPIRPQGVHDAIARLKSSA
jgi:two-component system sensor histidine kinase BarA